MWLLGLILYVIGFMVLAALLFAAFMGLTVAVKLAKTLIKSDPREW